jgi:hypothetical protein
MSNSEKYALSHGGVEALVGCKALLAANGRLRETLLGSARLSRLGSSFGMKVDRCVRRKTE